MSSIKHKSLAAEGIWRIAALGPTISHTPTRDNPSLDLRILVRLRSLDTAPTENDHTVEVPIGELPLLYHEAVVINGVITQGTEHEAKLRSGSAHLDFSPEKLKTIHRFDSRNDELIIPLQNGSHLANDPRLNGYFLAIENDGDPYGIVIPSIEIFRFFYATSAAFTKSLFNGDILDFEHRILYDRKTDSRGTSSFVLRTKMRDADALYLARFAFSEYALNQAKNIHIFWAARNAEQNSRAPITAITANPPIIGKHLTKFLYKNFESDGRSRKLITKILVCHCPPPCKTLSYQRDNDATPGNKETVQNTTSPQPQDKSNAGHFNTPPSELSDEAPNHESSQSEIQDPAIDDRFPDFKKVNLKKIYKKDNNKIKKPEASNAEDNPEEVGSTVDPHSSGKPIPKTSVAGGTKINVPEADMKQVPELTEDIDTTEAPKGHDAVIERLEWINTYTSAIVNYRLALPFRAVVKNAQVNVYPPTLDEKEKRWLYTNYELKQRRFAILAEVTAYNKTWYLLELQKIPRREQYSTIVFWGTGVKPVTREDITKILLSCAYEGKASLFAADCPHIQWGRLNHSPRANGESEAVTAFKYLKRIWSVKPSGYASISLEEQ